MHLSNFSTVIYDTGVPRGKGARGFKPPPLKVQNILNFMFATEYCSYSLNPEFLQENVNNCALISHSASASGGHFLGTYKGISIPRHTGSDPWIHPSDPTPL